MTSTRPAGLLYRLQTLDLEIARRRTRLMEIDALLSNDEHVAQARRRFEAAEAALKPWLVRSRDLDLEIKGITQKAQNAEQVLYGGSVRNPKELQDMEHELEALKRRQRQLEDELLEAMVEVEERQAAVVEAQQALEAATAAWTGSQADLLAEQRQLTEATAALDARRRQEAAALDPALLTLYERLRQPKHGRVVALLEGESCTACGVEQTSMIVQQVRHSPELIYCENCGRILSTP